MDVIHSSIHPFIPCVDAALCLGTNVAWSRIIGHGNVVNRFRQALERGRLSHAYLLVGPEGIGKELFARELAKAVQCASGPVEACDRCPACQKVEHGNHPDVAFVRRSEGGARGERKAQILVDQVREQVLDAIALKPFEGRFKVFAVADAERMTEEAQNCLLKTLEEPPPHSLLVLLACRLEPFVDTVVSRCQIVRFRPLSLADAERILTAGHGLDAERARELARLAEGSPGRALRYHTGSAYETARWLLGELAKVQPGGEFVLAAELLDKGREEGGSLEDARERLRPLLDLLGLAWRDLLLRSGGYPQELLTWGASHASALDALCQGLSPAAARRLAALAVETRDRLDANANIKLLVEMLILNTVALLRSRAARSA
ncbi:MAG: DNA polymerase III subunit delta' [Planctomycetes bacterium]|nr:DNA polymerase III subunit delta' [Planctomycetota bacterium]